MLHKIQGMTSDTALSILIPTYNCICVELVKDLQKQCSLLASLKYEILVADDGSSDTAIISTNRTINIIPNCKYLEKKENRGRSAIRNYLAQSAHHDLLLYIDSHMSVISDTFISNYLEENGHPLVYGGYAISDDVDISGNLRYSYEKANISKQKCAVRSLSPYLNFHTSNFMVHRDVMISFPLDERFKHYGYEDVLFGKVLQENGIPIYHIDNPVGFNTYESNERYMEKTEEGLNTLLKFRSELSGYSRLLHVCDLLDKYHLSWIPRKTYHLLGTIIRRNLTGTSPSLFLFKLYRLCYFTSLSKDKY